MKDKRFIVFIITYLVATLIRGLTGISFNPFFDKFDLVLLIKDLMIWTISYFAVSFIVSKFNKR